MTAREYADKHGMDDKTAKKHLEKRVAAGTMRKAVYDEMVYRRVRGYSGKYMPTKVTHYYEI